MLEEPERRYEEISVGNTSQVTAAARIDRLPIFSMHRKLSLVLVFAFAQP